VSTADDLTLNNCRCCEPESLPSVIYNRPGLPAFNYRIGKYGTFMRRMLNRLSSYALPDGDRVGGHPLSPLSTREMDDPSVALLDASAIVADVLTFYQERIVNEGFLRTSVERQSILELARAIGYELGTGVAASTYLAFTIEDAPGAPTSAEIPVGTKVQSIPPQGKLPQAFETVEDITAHRDWNAIHPRLAYPQAVSTATEQIYLQGTATNLKVGDRMLIDSGGLQTLVSIVEFEIQLDKKQTRLAFAIPASVSPFTPPDDLEWGQVDTNTQVPLNKSNITTYIVEKKWTDDSLNAFLIINQWDRRKLLTYLQNDRKTNPQASGQVYALRTRVGFFGNNAPVYATLPAPANAGQPWDPNGWAVWNDQQNTGVAYYSDADVFLERVVQGLSLDSGSSPRSWAVFEVPGDYEVYVIDSVVERSLGAFAMSGKSTGLNLIYPNGNPINKYNSYQVRTTTAHLQGELLPLVELPMDEALESDLTALNLDSLVLGLRVGQAIVLSGERLDAPGVQASEVLIIREINHIAGFTQLTFVNGRHYNYKRSTLTINANVVRSTHGETTSEILGNGSGAQANQRFTLRKPPLTYISAATPSGTESTLQVRVNDILWKETDSLYPLGRNHQQYIVRIGEDGKPTLIFGDGKHGARLPTGSNNVVAKYRSGIGLDGEVKEDTLTMLASKPLGVKAVTNPLPAMGGDDPEKMDNARQNAPLTVRTLDRIVTLADYEDFARALAGIGKAQSVKLWANGTQLVHLTVAGANGDPIVINSLLYDNLVSGISRSRDFAQIVRVDTFSRLLFNVDMNVAVDKRYIRNDIFANIRMALQKTYAFDMRGFGQLVTSAEVITTIQQIEGVIAVDLNALYLFSENVNFNSVLPSQIARVENGNILLAQLLLINPIGITLEEMKP
jgi:hypothetical protein